MVHYVKHAKSPLPHSFSSFGYIFFKKKLMIKKCRVSLMEKGPKVRRVAILDLPSEGWQAHAKPQTHSYAPPIT